MREIVALYQTDSCAREMNEFKKEKQRIHSRDQRPHLFIETKD